MSAIPGAAAAAPGERFVLLEPVRAADGKSLMRTAPDGGTVPVVRIASTHPAAERARQVLATGFAAMIPRLDTVARSAAKRKTACRGLPAATFVFLSDEDGGFARQGFFVDPDAGEPAFCGDHFIDVTADEASIASGEFEEVLAHEWGHVLLRRLLGPMPPVPSRKFHSVRTVTDRTTAFDEGFGIHLQPVAAAMTKTPGFAARVQGPRAPSLADLWFSREETWLRETMVPQNRFAFDKPPAPQRATAYDRWLADEASSAVDPCRLKSGEQMMASEGAAAGLFHKLRGAGDDEIEAHYRRLIAVLAHIGHWPQDRAPLIALVEAWGEVFPERRDAVTAVFLDATHAATASPAARGLRERAACAGASGDIRAFLATRAEAQAASTRLLEEVLSRRVALDAALGPQLWIAGPTARISAAPWQPDRNLPLTLDLNTARAAELELAFDGTPAAGAAAGIVRARESGPFASITDLGRRAGIGVPTIEAIERMAQAFGALPPAIRK
jgi:hypothetical protein